MEKLYYSLCSALRKVGWSRGRSQESGSAAENYPIGENFWKQDIYKKQYLTAGIKSIVLVCAIAYLFYERLWAIFVMIPLGIYFFRIFVKQEMRKKTSEFEKQFLDALQSLQAQMNVGYSMENAIKEVRRDLLLMYKKNSLIVKEFTYMTRQLGLNITAEQVWLEFAERVKLSVVDSFVTVFVLSKRSGGDSIAIIRNTVRQLNDRAEVREEIETVITAKKLEFHVMTVIPLGMIFYMKLSFPEFIDPLYGSVRGICFMSICLMLYFAAWKLGCYIVEIEV